MHYKGHLITKKLPTEDQLSKILDKYYYENDNEKFSWDWYQVGGRYGGQIKIKFNPDTNEFNWYSFKNRNNKYFISYILNKLKAKDYLFDELDYMIYMGLRENVLYVDGGYFNDTINFDITECFLVIDDDENIYVRETWENEQWVKHNDFDENVKKIDLKDKFITIIDFHD